MRVDDERCRPSEERYCFSAPWFKHFNKEWIDRYADMFRKVIENHEQLLDADKNAAQGGRWYGTDNN